MDMISLKTKIHEALHHQFYREKNMEQISFASKRTGNSWAIGCGWLLEALVQMIPKKTPQRCSKILAQYIGGKDILIPDVFQVIGGSKPTEHVIV